jgi:MFS family permease
MMLRVFAPISALLLSVAFLLAGNGLQGTLLPIRAGMELFTTPDIGILGSAYYIGFALGCLLGGRILRRAGHIRTFTAMASIASAVALGHALVLTPWFWWFARAISGACLAILFMVIESWLNERSTKETRGTVMSIYLIINLTVITVGQMMITLYDPGGWPLFALASILISLAAVPIAFTASPPPAAVQVVSVRIWRLYRLSPVGFAGCVAVGLANGSFWSLGPVYAQRTGLDVAAVAVFMSATVLAGAAGQWPLGRASDRVDRRYVIAIACTGAALAAAALASGFLVAPAQILTASCVFGIFAFPIYAIAVAHTNDHVPQGEYVESSSGLLLLFGAGAVIGPLAASFLMSRIGPQGLYMFTAVVHVGLAVFALYRIHRRERVSADERTTFRHGLEVASTVSTSFEEGEAESGTCVQPALEARSKEE